MIIKPILWPRKRVDGSQNIKIYVCKSRKDKKYVTTEYNVLSSEWDDKKWVLKDRANYEFINYNLRLKVSECEKLLLLNKNKRVIEVLNEEKKNIIKEKRGPKLLSVAFSSLQSIL